MFRNFFSVGALTALSRLTGFLREMAIGALMGQTALADAYFVAIRLPNSFRAIFGEGAFNSAYVPTYTHVLNTEGEAAATDFASRVLTLLAISQLILLAIAYADMPLLVGWIAPHFDRDPHKFDLAVQMTRITFPYLAFVTIAILHTGTLNAHGYFAAGAFAPVLLNLFIIGFLAIAFLFPNAGIAASWGVVLSGAAQLGMLVIEAARIGVLERFAWPRLDANVRQFFRTLGPGVISSGGQQIALLADTILASGMRTGAVAAINYAERLYQLPLGLIGVAAGTVLLPEMSRRIALGDDDGAVRAQNRTTALSLALAAPFLVGFLMIPEEIIRGAYMRGVFDAEAARRSAHVLAAYGLGVIPMVLINSARSAFQARGDTKTPMYCFFAGLAVNIALKYALSGDFGAVGLAVGTAAGAWINYGLLVLLGRWRELTHPSDRLYENIALTLFSAAGAALAMTPALGAAERLALSLPVLRNEFTVAAAFGAVCVVYVALYALASLLFGRSLRRQLL